MRTYMMKDKIKDIYDTIDKFNEELAEFTDIKGVGIHMTELPMGTLGILGVLPGMNAAIKKSDFTECVEFKEIEKPESCLKKVRKQVRTSWK